MLGMTLVGRRGKFADLTVLPEIGQNLAFPKPIFEDVLVVFGDVDFYGFFSLAECSETIIFLSRLREE